MSSKLAPRPDTSRAEVRSALRAIYDWSYDSEIDQLRTLYANALERQWISVRDLDWERGIDQERFANTFSIAGLPIQNTEFWKHLDPDVKWEVSRRTSAFQLSNFLHGEQGALMVASQLVSAVPHMDAKFYASTQTVDEARHVEVFAAYIGLLDEVYPIDPSVKHLLDETIGSESWIHKLVGMQVVVEGMALYLFRDMRRVTEEPLLKQLLTYVSRDEARHTGYGIKYLPQVLATLSDTERRELEDFAFEGSRLLIGSRAGPTLRESIFKIWTQAGLDPAAVFQEIAKEREKMRGEVNRSGGIFGPLRGFLIPTMRSIGLFSERLEGFYRDLFARRMSEQAAKPPRRLNFDAELPEDLEAWVLSDA